MRGVDDVVGATAKNADGANAGEDRLKRRHATTREKVPTFQRDDT